MPHTVRPPFTAAPPPGWPQGIAAVEQLDKETNGRGDTGAAHPTRNTGTTDGAELATALRAGHAHR